MHAAKNEFSRCFFLHISVLIIQSKIQGYIMNENKMYFIFYAPIVVRMVAAKNTAWI